LVLMLLDYCKCLLGGLCVNKAFRMRSDGKRCELIKLDYTIIY